MMKYRAAHPLRHLAPAPFPAALMPDAFPRVLQGGGNDATIRFVSLWEVRDIFIRDPIETEGRELVLAHGAANETLLDDVGRSQLDNHREYLELYSAERINPEAPRPRVSSQWMLLEHPRARPGLLEHGTRIAAEPDVLMRRLQAARGVSALPSSSMQNHRSFLTFILSHIFRHQRVTP